MQKYIIKKEIIKRDGPYWKTIYSPGHVIIYNNFLGGWTKPAHYYKWEVITKEEIDSNPTNFEVYVEKSDN